MLIQILDFMVLKQRGRSLSVEKETPASDEDAVAEVMESHEQFVSSMYARLAKLQVCLSNVHISRV